MESYAPVVLRWCNDTSSLLQLWARKKIPMLKYKSKSTISGIIALSLCLLCVFGNLMRSTFVATSPEFDSVTFLPQNKERLCRNFFTTLGSTNHGGYLEDSCSKAEFNLQNETFQNLHIQNEIMKSIGSTLTVFLACNPSNWNERTVSEFNEDYEYTHISFRSFDRDALFSKFDFESKHVKLIRRMNAKPASFSDIYRLLLAAEHRMAYIDCDMFLISNDLNLFLNQPTIAAPVWNDFGASIEIQNSGFCLPNHALAATMQMIRSIMETKKKRQRYAYTELGPHAMQRSIRSWGPVVILPTIHPEERDVEKIVKQVERYQIPWVHLCGNHRKGRDPKDVYHGLMAGIAASEKNPTQLPFV